MNLSAVINQLISLFLMILLGYVAAASDLISPDFRKKLSAMTLGVSAPCIILSSALSSDIAAGEMITVLLIAALFFVLMIALASVFVRLMRAAPGERRLDQLMLVFTNVGFMGIPMVQSVYGATGVAMVSMFILMFNLVFFSYGVMLISGSARLDLKALKSPCIFAAMGALVLALTGWRLPVQVESTLSAMGATNTPLSMLIIGASLRHSDLRAALTNPRLYKISLVSMLVMPLCMLACMRLLPISPTLAGVAVVLSAMPIAGNCAMISDLYTPDDMTASQAVIVSTLMSAVTLPVICYIMTLVL